MASCTLYPREFKAVVWILVNMFPDFLVKTSYEKIDSILMFVLWRWSYSQQQVSLIELKEGQQGSGQSGYLQKQTLLTSTSESYQFMAFS